MAQPSELLDLVDLFREHESMVGGGSVNRGMIGKPALVSDRRSVPIRFSVREEAHFGRESDDWRWRS
jgi:hypothetical protein